MTQSLTLNTENNTKETYVGNLLLNSKMTSDKQSFSKLIDNINAKTNQIQTNFISQAKKTNISSVNKKAIKNTTNIQNTKSEKKSISNEKSANSKDSLISETNKDTKNTPTTKKISHNDKLTKAINTSDKISKDTTNYKTDSNNLSKDELSDTNNSSPVNPSPVISFEGEKNSVNEIQNQDSDVLNKNVTTDTIDMAAVSDQAVSTAAVVSTSALTTENADEITSKIEEFGENISIDENSLNVVEKIASVAQESNLPDKTKQELNELVSKMQDFINSKNNDEINFNQQVQSNEDIQAKEENVKTDETKTIELKN